MVVIRAFQGDVAEALDAVGLTEHSADLAVERERGVVVAAGLLVIGPGQGTVTGPSQQPCVGSRLVGGGDHRQGRFNDSCHVHSDEPRVLEHPGDRVDGQINVPALHRGQDHPPHVAGVGAQPRCCSCAAHLTHLAACHRGQVAVVADHLVQLRCRGLVVRGGVFPDRGERPNPVALVEGQSQLAQRRRPRRPILR